MRPVNLIPPDQRKGAARGAGAENRPVGVYVLFGVLGVAVLGVLALVLTSNKINSKTGELAKVQAQAQSVKQVADALRPYGSFAQVAQSREADIAALASTRFDWQRALHQLALAIPSNVWLLNLAGTLSPSVTVEDSGGGETSTLRQKVDAPAFAITGCTYSQHAVARMMTRMQNLDDVTDVQLAKSARKDQQGPSGGTATPAPSASASQNIQDCTGPARVTTFDMLIVFGGAASASPDAASSGSAVTGVSTPNSTAQSLAKADNAAATAQSASSAAGASTGAKP